MRAATSNSPIVVCEELRVGDAKDSVCWIAVYGRGLFDAGRCVKVGGVVIDVSERKRSESRSQLVVDEFRHRVRNAFTIIQAMVAQTLRTTDSMAEAQLALTGRLVALSRTQSLLSETYWAHATVESVLLRETLAFQDAGERIALSGPATGLNPDFAAGLSMLIHELATNALKYGALSNDEGRVDVSWSREVGVPAVRLEWRERGGPAVSLPKRAGFGTHLIREALRRPAFTTVDFDPAGLVCVISDLPVVVSTPEPGSDRLRPDLGSC